MDRKEEKLAAEIHGIYCKAGDYSKLDELTKDYDRAFVRWHLSQLAALQKELEAARGALASSQISASELWTKENERASKAETRIKELEGDNAVLSAMSWSARYEQAEAALEAARTENERIQQQRSAILQQWPDNFKCSHSFFPVGFPDGSWHCGECWAEDEERRANQAEAANKRLREVLEEVVNDKELDAPLRLWAREALKETE